MTGEQDTRRCQAIRFGMFMRRRDWDRRAQSIDFAVGQVLCMRAAVSGALDEWDLRRVAAEHWERRHAFPAG